MLGKRKKTVDERIQKRENELRAKMFPYIWIANTAVLIIKAVYGLPVIVYAVEILALVLGTAVWLIGEARYGILFVKEKDEVLKELSAKAKAKAFTAMFEIVIMGELLYVFFADETYFSWVITYFISWLPPALFISIKGISEGLLIVGSKTKEKKTKKSFALRTLVGSIFFGLISGSSFYLDQGVFKPKGLIAVPLLAVGWGVPFYLIMAGIVEISEKKADKIVKKSEARNEE